MPTAARFGLTAMVTLVLLVLFGPNPAQAHAILERAAPAQDGIVATAPHQVTLQFSENVSGESDSVRIFDAAQKPVRTGPTHFDGKRVTISFPANARPGTYSVSWQVISADSHPVSGSFAFSVGHRSAQSGTVGARHPDRMVRILVGASRFAGYAGVVLGLGLVAVLLGLWPAGRTVRRVGRLVWSGWWLMVLGAAGGFLLQGPYGASRSVGAVFDGELLSTTLDSRFGVAVAARLSVLLVLGILLLIALSGLAEITPMAAGIGICAASILVSYGLAGHAGDGSVWSLAMLADVLHIGAMAVWLGGLVLLIGCLLAADRIEALEHVLPRFSRWALVAFAVIAATGTFRAWQTVGAWAALPDTLYGRLLLAKIGGFVLLGALGELARRWVRHRRRSWRHGSGLRLEVAIGAAVLVVTSILVGTAQAKESYAPTRTVSSASATTKAAVTADPAHTGRSDLRLAVTTPSGVPQSISQITATISCTEKGIAPLPVRFTGSGRGTARAVVTFSVPGTWDIDLTVRTGAVEATAFRLRMPVR
ncbi:MAG TPA: copper resistance protein CopC [Mycobacteriales bacterium]|nr:copper resistance protein CopC [Mycobacteriales bacterium]